MSTFDSLGISGSGLLVHRKWLDAVSDNIANINNVTSTDQDAFQERLIVAQAVDYGSGEGGVRVGDQMTQLIMAQRGYQANLAVVERATTAYQAALQLGKG
jgi:flagellar basal-body rod protein FlgC